MICNVLLLPLIGQINLETKGWASLGKKCSFLYYKAEQEKAEEGSESNQAVESTFYIFLWKWKWRVGELHCLTQGHRQKLGVLEFLQL